MYRRDVSESAVRRGRTQGAIVYEYQATVTEVYDGDTITVDIDCGFGIWLRDQKIRLYGIDTPEMRGPEKEKGKQVRDWLRARILNEEITLITKKDSKGKYGRWLGVVFHRSRNINLALIDNGMAEVYEP